MKIAVVGGGISGLAAAYFLHREHEVVVLEAGDYAGGHTHTIDVTEGDRSIAVDTGFIVYNRRTYPLFCRLMNEIGVAGQPTSMSFSVRCDRTGLEYRGADLNGFFAQRSNLFSWRYYRFLNDLLRFNRIGLHYVQAEEEISVREFFQRESFTTLFRDHYFYPMASAVWSCPRGKIDDFPVRFVLEFYHHHGLLSVTQRPQWLVIQGGSRNYVGPLTRGFENRIWLRTPVTGVQRDAAEVQLRLAAGETISCDHVIFACHSDQALKILGEGATSTERELLSAFPYEANDVVLHTDTSLLPKTRRAWACWNYLLPTDPADKATVTYNMNLLQSLTARETYCVSLNRTSLIDPDRILGRFTYHHPVFNGQRRAAQSRHAELLGPQRTSFCGAYWRNGFHEDGVQSAWAVSSRLLQREGTWNHAFTQEPSGIAATLPSRMNFATASR